MPQHGDAAASPQLRGGPRWRFQGRRRGPTDQGGEDFYVWKRPAAPGENFLEVVYAYAVSAFWPS